MAYKICFPEGKKLVLAPLYLMHNAAPSSSSRLTYNSKQLRLKMRFSLQYLEVKDADQEYALLLSL